MPTWPKERQNCICMVNLNESESAFSQDEISESNMAETICPPKFKASDSNAWREYKEDLQTYLTAAGLQGANEPKMVAIQLYGLDTKHKKIFKTLTFNEDHKKDVARVTATFEEHFEPKKLYMKIFESCYQR